MVVHDRKMLFMLPIFLAVIVLAIVLSDFFDDVHYGITREGYIIIAAGIFIVYQILRFIQDLNYIFYSDNGEKITFKFYSLRPFAKKRQSFEIAKSTFIKFETEKILFGLKESIILYQRIKNKTAKYPPLSISSLTKKEKEQLFASLIAYSKQKPN